MLKGEIKTFIIGLFQLPKLLFFYLLQLGESQLPLSVLLPSVRFPPFPKQLVKKNLNMYLYLLLV